MDNSPMDNNPIDNNQSINDETESDQLLNNRLEIDELLNVKQKSCLDRSICCVFSRKICTDIIYPLLILIFVLAQLASFGFQYGYGMDKNYNGDELGYKVGIYIHISLLISSLLMTSYLGRYLSDSKTTKLNHYLGYCMCVMYSIAILFMWCAMGFGLLGADDIPNNIQYQTNMFKMLFLNYGSFVIISLWICIIKPFIPNLYYVFKNFTINGIVRHGFYETKDDIQNILSSTMCLSILFGVSTLTANVGVRFYKIDTSYYYGLLGLSVVTILLTLLLQIPIIIAYRRNEKFFNKYLFEQSLFGWLFNIISMTILAISVFFVFLPYNGWSKLIDNSYVTTSMVLVVFLMVQGSIYLLFLMAIIIWLLTFIPKCMSFCCKSCKKIQQDAVDEVYENTV